MSGSFVMRRYIQAVLRRMGYQLVRNTRPRPMVGTSHGTGTTIPVQLQSELQWDNPRLVELRERYAATDLPMLSHSWWTQDYLEKTLDLQNFRGDNAYVWQTRHLSDATLHRYFLYARDVADRDELKLFSKLDEDGAFGCWLFHFRQFPALSRDLLDSVNELNFIERHAKVSQLPQLRVLDIGAGYGRLAHRTHSAFSNLADYACLDGIAESSFLCEVYTKFRACDDKVRVVAADELDTLNPGAFDLAINVHSFSEMCLSAIQGWLDLVVKLQIPRLFIIPNDPESFLSVEADDTRIDFLPLIESRGFRLVAKEPAIANSDVRELVGVQDHLCMFQRS